MTDGRIPGKWVTEPRFAEMDSDTWAIFTRALAWSNEAGTDGAVKQRYLGMFHNSGELLPHCYDNLEALGLWRKTAGGYQFEKWDTPAHRGGLGQATAETVRNGKARNAAKQRRFRERLAGGDDSESEAITPSNPVTSPGHVGQDTTGQDTTGQANYGGDAQNEKTATAAAVAFAEIDSLPVDLRTGEVAELAPCCGRPHSTLTSCAAAAGGFG